MLHRHLNHQEYTLAAIDSVLSRGRLGDWLGLARAMQRDAELPGKVQRICEAHIADPYDAQRYAAWSCYVRRHHPDVKITAEAERSYRVMMRAREVFLNEAGAWEWLRTPQRALGGCVPLELITSDDGAQDVINVLAAIEDGGYL